MNTTRGPWSRFKARWAGWEWPERLQFLIALLLQLALLGVFFGALEEERWLVAFTALVVLVLTYLPAVIERQLAIQLPIEFTLATCLFLYAAFGLGEVQRFYHRFWWWDLLLHSVSALVMGIIGFLLVYTFHQTRRVVLPPLYFAFTAFGFAVTLGTLWEIFEFLMDWGFGFNMQKSGLPDTMTDLMVDVGGAAVAAWIGFHYVRDGDSLVADRLLRRLVAKNPRLFRQDSDSEPA
ncbi:hypothetical protein [Thiohalorhabdus methylotrophus]|uniref:DUF2238 domain-containing protein n=1 Tax=Thiohalorhabdus methylotrophus TaxID=3242694 RepID=A0ABV4TR20_9GAMM